MSYSRPTSLLTVQQFSELWWLEVCKKLKRAAVFIDNQSAECLHWNGGLLRLMDAGCVSVKEFCSFEVGDPNQKKAVFILSSAISGYTADTLRDIIRGSSFEYCVIITSASAAVHHFANHGNREGEDVGAFRSLEEDILQWMGNMNYTVEILSIPLFTANITPDFFVTPPFSDLNPLVLQRHLQANKIGDSPSDIDLFVLPQSLQLSVCQLTGCLHQLFTQIGVREDIYSVGQSARILAAELDALPAARNRRKTATNRLSLLLVDRALDMVAPSSHPSEPLLERILAVLPSFPGHANDVAVTMSAINKYYVKMSDGDCSVSAPGCLAHTEDKICCHLLETLATKKQKECLIELHRKLSEASGKQIVRPPTRVSAETLEKDVLMFDNSIDTLLAFGPLLQQTLAVVETLKHPSYGKMDVLNSIEKLLLQNVASGDEQCDATQILTQITQLILTRHDRGIGVDDILTLLLHLYSLVGRGMLKAEEASVRSALMHAIVEDQDYLSSSALELVGIPVNLDTAEEAVDVVFSRLHCIANARDDLRKYKNLYWQESKSHPVQYEGLLKHLVRDMSDPSRPEMPDVICRSSGVRDILKSGLGLFMNVSRPHPLDNPILLVFVIGGVTVTEAKEIQEGLKGKVKVLVGGTRIASPRSTLESLLGEEPEM